MRAVVAGDRRRARGAARAVAVALTLLALATAAGGTASGATTTGTTHPASRVERPAPPAQDERLAGFLRRDPVYVSDQIPRSVPRSWQPRFAALARRAGVPTYVLVLPSAVTVDDSLLAGVHDRLGKPGLYVVMSDDADLKAVAFGVDADAADARTVAEFDTPDDAGPLAVFETFVDTVRLGPSTAAARAAAVDARLAKSDGDDDRPASPQYISYDRRDDQSFDTGALMMGGPLCVLLFGLYGIRLVRRRRGRTGPYMLVKGADRVLAGKGAGKATRPGAKPAVPDPVVAPAGRVRPVVALVAAAAGLALVVGVSASHLYRQTLDGPVVRPTHADLTARADRVAAGLAHDPVYLDPEGPPAFTGAQLTALERRIAAFTPGPVYVAAVPMDLADESEGDPDAFLTTLHATAARPGVYVVADTASGQLEVGVWGLKLEPDPVPEAVTDIPDGVSDDHRFPQRLDRLMTFLDGLPRTARPADNAYPTAPDPLDDHRLPPLFSGQFGQGLIGGGLIVAIAFLVLLACVALGRRLLAYRRARTGRGGPRALTGVPGEPEPPARPSAAHLRRTAQHAIEALAAEFAATDADADADAPDSGTATTGAGKTAKAPKAADRKRAAGQRGAAYACLDAALLLVDRAPDGRIDDAVAPGDLVAAIVLAGAGRQELAGRPVGHVCAVNPLHGRVAGKRAGRRGGRVIRKHPVCPACLELRLAGSDLADRRLRLPDRRGTIPYGQAPGALSHLPDGIAALIEKVKEYAHVR